MAIGDCVAMNIPFVAFSLPGEKEFCHFFASLPDSEGRSPVKMSGNDTDCFILSRFAADEPYTSGVMAQYDARGIEDYICNNRMVVPLPFSPARPSLISTSRVAHMKHMSELIRAIKTHGDKDSKVVLSVHRSLFASVSISALAARYIQLNPSNFGYICYTPENGLWFGSTPEVLAESEVGSDIVNTMALAGTRWDPSVPWDKKNIREHKIVVDYITDTLRSLGYTVTKGRRHNLRTGGVEHMCTLITGRGDHSFVDTVNHLNPTPAVCGTPLPLAMTSIDLLETHQRHCYSGALLLRYGGKLRAYVNLRCGFAAQAWMQAENERISGWVINLYSGGGILADSDPATEWEETQRKQQPIIDSILSCQPGEPMLVMENPVNAHFGYANTVIAGLLFDKK